jgi:hypothetical protein
LPDVEIGLIDHASHAFILERFQRSLQRSRLFAGRRMTDLAQDRGPGGPPDKRGGGFFRAVESYDCAWSLCSWSAPDGP